MMGMIEGFWDNLVPRAFPLKNGKSPGDEVGFGGVEIFDSWIFLGKKIWKVYFRVA